MQAPRVWVCRAVPEVGMLECRSREKGPHERVLCTEKMYASALQRRQCASARMGVAESAETRSGSLLRIGRWLRHARARQEGVQASRYST